MIALIIVASTLALAAIGTGIVHLVHANVTETRALSRRRSTYEHRS